MKILQLFCRLFPLLSLLFAATAHAEAPKLLVDCGGAFDLCGFVDRDTKAEVIPRRFERANFFKEGLAGVRMKGLWGFVDERGKTVIEPNYDLVGNFYQGLAEVLVGKKVGAIDRAGNMVVEPQFRRAVPFTKDVLLVQEGEWRSQHFEGFEKFGSLNDYFSSYGKYGLYHIANGWIVKTKYNFSLFESEGRGLIWATESDGYTGPYGLLSADGTWRLEPRFNFVSSLKNGRARVRNDRRLDNGEVERLYGEVDHDGFLVTPFATRSIEPWDNGVTLTQDHGKKGFLDEKRNLIGDRMFEKAYIIYSSNRLRVYDDGKWFELRRDGSLGPDPIEGEIISQCPSGMKLLRRGEKLRLLGKDGTTLISDIEYVAHMNCDQPTILKTENKWTFFSVEGQLFSLRFDDLFEFADGYSAVAIGKKWGVIDTQGKYTLEPRYDKLIPRGKGTFFVADEKRWIDFKGDEQPAPKPSQATRDSYLACSGGAKLFVRDGLWGIAGAGGEYIVKPAYRAITCFRHGVAWAAIDARKQWCAIDPDGSVREKPACKETNYPYIQTHHYPERFSEEPYESSVLWTRAFLEFGANLREAPPKMLSDGAYESSTILR